MNITIVSAYTWYNKGDAAILLGTITELEEFYNEKGISPTFNILSFTPDVDKTHYSKLVPNIKVVESNIFNPYPLKKDKVNKAKAILKMGLQFLYLNTLSKISLKYTLSKVKALQVCNESDLIIVCGGGFLGGNKYNSLMHIAQLHLIHKLNNKTVLWGTSIEPPTKKLLKFLTEQTLMKLDFILPREEVTEIYLEEWYSKEKIVKSPDMAFKTPFKKTIDIENVFNNLKLVANKRKIIGITMRDWFFPKSSDPTQDLFNYEKALIELIDNRHNDNLFVFVPQVIMYGDDDRIFAEKIKSQLEFPDSFVILDNDFSPYELKWIISQFNQFLGTRMHSNIFSSTMKLPPVAIAYESKTTGIMKKLNLSDYTIDIEKVSSKILDDLLIKNKKNKYDLSKELDYKIDEFIKQIRFATEKVLESENK